MGLKALQGLDYYREKLKYADLQYDTAIVVKCQGISYVYTCLIGMDSTNLNPK